MSWLLTDQEFAEAATEIRHGEVNPALYSFLRRVVAAPVRVGVLSPALSPTGRWDEDAVDETLQSWLVKLIQGGLTRAFQVSASPRGLARYLERSLRNWLISESRSRGRPRLIARTQSLLQESEQYTKFVDASSWSGQWWGLSSWESPRPFEGGDSDLVVAAYGVKDLVPLHYTSGSQLSSPLVSTPELDRLISGILEELGALLTISHFDAAFRGRFAYAYDQPEIPLDSVEDSIIQLGANPLEITETAKEILSELTGRQLTVFQAKIEDRLTLEEIAERLSISRGTVDNELRRAGVIIRTHVLEDSQFELVVEKLLEMAFKDSGDGHD